MQAVTRRAITLSALVLGGVTLLALDLHRVVLRAVWPYLESFWFTNIAF
jgi:hypothetical protein